MSQKFTPKQLSKSLAADIAPALEVLFRGVADRRAVDGTFRDLFEEIRVGVLRRKSQVIVSPYANVSDELWLDAHELAADEIYEVEKRERDPSHDEIDRAFEKMQELKMDGVA